MSTIVSPYPPRERRPPAAQSMWWRFRLREGPDGNLMIQRTDNVENPSWWSVEFFDGEDTIIDAGLDRPTVDEVRTTYRHTYDDSCWGDPRATICIGRAYGFLDVLAVERPTPSPLWEPLTMPGEHIHPGERPEWERVNYHPSQLPPAEPRCTPSRHERLSRRSRWAWWPGE